MTAPYKIAVAAAATLLLVVIASLLLEKDPQPAGIDNNGPVVIADGRPAPSPPPGTFAPDPAAPPAQAVPALPFGDPTQPNPSAAAPPVDPARIEYIDPPAAAAGVPAAETFDVGRTAFDQDGKPRPSLFAPKPGAKPTPKPAVAAAPGVPLGPGDLITSPAEPGAPNPTPASASATAAPAPTYTIKSGDSLSSIALELYGSGNHWIEIAQANPLVDPDRLKVDQVIKLPAPPGTTPTIPPAVTPDRAPPPDLGAGTQYTVKENDTLSGIAKQFYNAASKWQFIYEANRAAIGSNPSRMKPGTVLTIPPPDTGAR